MAPTRKPVPASSDADRSDSRASDTTMQGDAPADNGSPTKRDRLNEKLGSPPGLVNEDGEPMHNHHFFDAEIAPLRKTFIKTTIMGLLLTILACLGFLSIYWAALYQPEVYLHKLQGVVVNYDQGGAIGQTVVQAMQAASGGYGHMSWYIADPADYPGGWSQVAQAVVDNEEWVGIVVFPDATARLEQAIASVDATWEGNSTIGVYTNEARNNNAYGAYIMPSFSQPLDMACQQFAQQQATRLAGNGGVNNLLANAPQLITRPIYYATYSLRPFNVPVTTAASYVGLIYLLILAFIVTLQSFTGRQPLEPKLRLTSLLAIRFCVPFICYFFLSLFYAFLTLAFQAPFSRYYGHAGFVIYWMLSWCGMLALGGAMEAMVTVLTQKFISFFLIIWIISNVAVAFYPIDLLPGVYHYGYAMPFWQIKESVLALLLGTKNVIGRSFGVLIAWAFLSFFITMPLLTILMRNIGVRKTRKAAEKKRDQS